MKSCKPSPLNFTAKPIIRHPLFNLRTFQAYHHLFIYHMAVVLQPPAGHKTLNLVGVTVVWEEGLEGRREGTRREGTRREGTRREGHLMITKKKWEVCL
jgi:hypothetical protein